MAHVAKGEPIIDLLYNFDMEFSYDQKGDPVFTLKQNGKKIGNEISIETHTATLVFNLVLAGGVSDVVWATNFQWLDPDTRAPVEVPPNILFMRDGDNIISMIDSNPVTEEGQEQRMHFLFSVLQYQKSGDPIMYTSSDPVIINKKPPE